ncbi:SWIB-domain-containing protein [Cystobasidium minutum MCA 4210]|uniref:SWIB-domain-containing protein n=1 Tax=Cystobasidium minutum MCA 4210 TaxID=1397322 RepID=UPI0034CFA309|eukprot:jgi/Rhomi1/169100/fgenesh1_kg.3_\
MDTKAITEHIRRILTAPDVDLATISSKKVRKVLAESFGASLIKENKEAIDALIIEAFNSIATAAGAASAPAPQPQASSSISHSNNVKSEPSNGGQSASSHVPAASAGAASASAQNGGSSTSTASNNKQRERDRLKQQQPEESDASEDGADEDYASGSTSAEEQPSKKSIKQSPQKRKIDAVASSSFPASSPNVPLSMTTGLTDEEYARKLQEEFNNMASYTGTRSTRGSGSGSRSSTSKNKKKSSSSNKRGKSESSGNGKYRSKAYIDDSDLEGEEGHDRSDGSASDPPPKKKKRKAPSGEGGGSGGGYNKELALSESLQKVCGVPTMSRPKIVKRLWEYIREHELQDPNKRSDIINDDLFKEIFGVEKMTMFSMNKYLTKSVRPIDG